MVYSEKTLVILLGAHTWPEYPDFEASSAFTNSARDIETYFTDPTNGFNLPVYNLANYFDSPMDPNNLDIAISGFLKKRITELEKTGTKAENLILYYVGHGGFTNGNDEYFLAVHSTRKANPDISSIRIRSLAKTLKEKARYLKCYIILDCCFSGVAGKSFQSTLDEVVETQNIKVLNTIPGKGITILTSASSTAASMIAPNKEYTMFTEALLQVLKMGNEEKEGYLSIRDIKDIINDILIKRYNGTASKAEVHSPFQTEGDIADLGLFPNIFHKKNFPNYQDTNIEGYEGNILKCYVLISETEEKSSPKKNLSSIVNRTLEKYEKDIRSIAGKLPTRTITVKKNVSDIFSNEHEYLTAIRNLCQSEIAVFDVTNFEPSAMLLLGIRSVVRRGITILSMNSDLTDIDISDYPFNIKDVNIVKRGDKEYPIAPIGSMILEGFNQLAHHSKYLDLPAFDAIRELPVEPAKRVPKDCSEQVLVLCSFGKSYQYKESFKYLRENLSVVIRNRTGKEPEIVRTLDLKSPRLIFQSLYEAIRLTNLCIVDWTEWRPNVFFELGVRLASNPIAPICIIDHNDKNISIDEIPNDGKGEKIPPAYFKLLKYSTKQHECLLNFFEPFEYNCGILDDNTGKDFKKIVDRHEDLMGETIGNSTYQTITQYIDYKVEIAAKPVFQVLSESANLLINPDSDSEGRSNLLYPGNDKLIEIAEEGALERRLAAWFYIDNRFTQEEIIEKPKLTNDYLMLGNLIVSALRRMEKIKGGELAKRIWKKLKDLEKKKEKNNG